MITTWGHPTDVKCDWCGRKPGEVCCDNDGNARHPVHRTRLKAYWATKTPKKEAEPCPPAKQ